MSALHVPQTFYFNLCTTSRTLSTFEETVKFKIETTEYTTTFDANTCLYSATLTIHDFATPVVIIVDGDVFKEVLLTERPAFYNSTRAAAPTASATFGASLFVTDEQLFVAEPADKCVYVYELDTLGQAAPAGACAPTASASFGASLAVQGDLLFVGDPEYMYPSAAGNLNANDVAGAVFVFEYDEGTGVWVALNPLLQYNDEAGSEFGSHLEILDDMLLVSAPAYTVSAVAGRGRVTTYSVTAVPAYGVEFMSSAGAVDQHFGARVSAASDFIVFSTDVGELWAATYASTWGAAMLFLNLGSPAAVRGVTDGTYILAASAQDTNVGVYSRGGALEQTIAGGAMSFGDAAAACAGVFFIADPSKNLGSGVYGYVEAWAYDSTSSDVLSLLFSVDAISPLTSLGAAADAADAAVAFVGYNTSDASNNVFVLRDHGAFPVVADTWSSPDGAAPSFTLTRLLAWDGAAIEGPGSVSMTLP